MSITAIFTTVVSLHLLSEGLKMLLYPERVRAMYQCAAAWADAQFYRAGVVFLALGAVALLCVVL